ncbi:MAG: type III pantothenate kinase [Planctomycetota bacterium]|nr:type III pantothenate kinase [Planctomycetota bacterium]
MASILAVSVGNSRTSLARFDGGTLVEARRVDSVNAAAVVAEATSLADGDSMPLVLATVSPTASDAILKAVQSAGFSEVLRIGEEFGIPIATQVDDASKTGQDRLLSSCAAFRRLGQACVVVDAGTCVTVDFVDGAGVFQGGMISPGVMMQLNAMHEHTAALEKTTLTPVPTDTFGRNTSDAMRLGVIEGVRGLVQRVIERYATAYGAFPLVIATGGDAELLFSDDELINLIVPDLVLEGIASAWATATDSDDDQPKFTDPARPAAVTVNDDGE